MSVESVINLSESSSDEECEEPRSNSQIKNAPSTSNLVSDKESMPLITNGDSSDDHANRISVEPEEDISHPNGVQDLTAPNELPASPTKSVIESNGQIAEDTSERLKSNNDENPKQTKDTSILEETLVETDQQCPSPVPNTNDPDKAAKDEETTTHLSESSAASNPMVVEEDEFSNDSEYINTATIQLDDNPQDNTAAGEAGKDKNNSHENREDPATVTTLQSEVASDTAGKEIRVNSNEILEKLNSCTISDDDIDHDSPKGLTAQQIADETEDVRIPIHDGRDSPTVPDWGSARTDGLKITDSRSAVSVDSDSVKSSDAGKGDDTAGDSDQMCDTVDEMNKDADTVDEMHKVTDTVEMDKVADTVGEMDKFTDTVEMDKVADTVGEMDKVTDTVEMDKVADTVGEMDKVTDTVEMNKVADTVGEMDKVTDTVEMDKVSDTVGEMHKVADAVEDMDKVAATVGGQDNVTEVVGTTITVNESDSDSDSSSENVVKRRDDNGSANGRSMEVDDVESEVAGMDQDVVNDEGIIESERTGEGAERLSSNKDSDQDKTDGPVPEQTTEAEDVVSIEPEHDSFEGGIRIIESHSLLEHPDVELRSNESSLMEVESGMEVSGPTPPLRQQALAADVMESSDKVSRTPRVRSNGRSRKHDTTVVDLTSDDDEAGNTASDHPTQNGTPVIRAVPSLPIDLSAPDLMEVDEPPREDLIVCSSNIKAVSKNGEMTSILTNSIKSEPVDLGYDKYAHNRVTVRPVVRAPVTPPVRAPVRAMVVNNLYNMPHSAMLTNLAAGDTTRLGASRALANVANQSNSSIHAPIPIISPTIHHYPSASSTLANVAARRIVQQTGNPAQPVPVLRTPTPIISSHMGGSHMNTSNGSLPVSGTSSSVSTTPTTSSSMTITIQEESSTTPADNVTTPTSISDNSNAMLSLDNNNMNMLRTPVSTPQIGVEIPSTFLLEQYSSLTYVAPLPPAHLKFASVKHYICRYCGFEFALSVSLLNHQRQQSFKIIYDCVICKHKRTFYNRCSLLAHIFSHIKNSTSAEKRDYGTRLTPLLSKIRMFTLRSEIDFDSMLTMTQFKTLDDLMPGFTTSAVVKKRVVPKKNNHSAAKQVDKRPKPGPKCRQIRPSNSTVSSPNRQNGSSAPGINDKTSSASGSSVNKVIDLSNDETPNASPEAPVSSPKRPTAFPNITAVSSPSAVAVVQSRNAPNLENTPKATNDASSSPRQRMTLKIVNSKPTLAPKPAKPPGPTCHECRSSVTNLAQHYRRTSRPDFGKPPLSCNLCNKLISNECSLASHLRAHSAQPPYVCPECGMRIAGGPKAYDQHINRSCCHPHHHMLLDCHLCKSGNLFNNYENFLVHYIQEHCKKFSKCEFCPMAFKTVGGLEKHLQTSHSAEVPDKTAMPKIIYKCSICKEIVLHIKQMKSHLGGHLKTMVSSRLFMYVCPATGCGYSTPELSLFKKHLDSSHSTLKTLCRCFICSVSFAEFDLLHTHYLESHPSKCVKDQEIPRSQVAMVPPLHNLMMVCKDCSILFDSRREYIEHKEWHRLSIIASADLHVPRKRKNSDFEKEGAKHLKGDVDFIDVESNASSRSASSAYTITEEDPRPQITVEEQQRLRCTICKMMFGTASSLDQHLVSVHKHKITAPCHQCGVVFTSKEELKCHYNTTHSTKDQRNPYVCWLCTESDTHRAYGKPQFLEKHMMSVHKKSKANLDLERIRTPVVFEEIKAPSSLRQLRRDEDDTFTCAKCDYTSEIRKDFQQHILSHLSDEESLQCQECGLCFSVLPTLKRHLFIIHSVRDYQAYSEDLGLHVESDNDIADDSDELSPVRPTKSYHEHLNGGDEAVAELIQKGMIEDENECTVCYRVYDTEAQLRVHMRTHGSAVVRSKRQKTGDKARSPAHSSSSS